MKIIFIQEGESFLIEYKGKVTIGSTKLCEVSKKNIQTGNSYSLARLYIDSQEKTGYSMNYYTGPYREEVLGRVFTEVARFLAK